MEKEMYWSRFANDFEERNNYVAGVKSINAIKDELFQLNLKGQVLELGCGNGTYSKILSQTADKVTATDYSEEMVSASKERLRSIQNICVEQQNCFSLTYPNTSFDAIVMVNLLHVIENPEKVIDECKRVLKPSGILVVISFTTEGMSRLAKLGLLYRYLRTYGKPPTNAVHLSIKKTCQIVKANEFEVIASNLIGHSSKALFVTAKLEAAFQIA